jgi:SAM-dependent methyltransferase
MMRGPTRGYWFECDACGHLSSNLAVSIGGRAERILDEAARLRALERLRRSNFARVLDALDVVSMPRRSRLLDVGCGHGWFLDAAVLRGYDAVGVEPDADLAALARARNHRVIDGFFPTALIPDDRFDVVTFHDVFEHMDAPRLVVSEVFNRLNPGGIVVVNLPSSRGALFRIARALDAVGMHGPFDRMWQRGFPSPHLSYFTPDGLASLFVREGFREVHRRSLQSLSTAGLWSRLRYDGARSVPTAAALWLALTLAHPLLSVLPPDIMLHVFQRVDEHHSS